MAIIVLFIEIDHPIRHLKCFIANYAECKYILNNMLQAKETRLKTKSIGYIYV